MQRVEIKTLGVDVRVKEKEKHGLGYWGKKLSSKGVFLKISLPKFILYKQ